MGDRLVDAIDRYEDAKECAALEPEAAPDKVVLECGVCMLRPTLPHAWAIARVVQAEGLPEYDKNILCAWLLTLPQDEVRNSAIPQLRAGKAAELASCGEDYFIAQGAGVQEVLEALPGLLADLGGAKKKTANSG